MEDTLFDTVREIAQKAKKASAKLALTSADQRNAALEAMACALADNADAIVEANVRDMEEACSKGTTDSILDRLMLDVSRIEGMADGLRDLKKLPDPLGRIDMERVLYNGIELERISVPLGVVAVVYEARPNVGVDAAGICVKSGNAVILRGGSLARHSNEVISRVLSDAALSVGMPEGSVLALTTTDRAATDALMQMHGLVDVLIPRGGAGLIAHCVETSKVPVIETGTGNCHVYVHEMADLDMALDILVNAKCRRFGVCNAAETLLLDESIADDFLPEAMSRLAERDVFMHADARAMDVARDSRVSPDLLALATEEDWATEYLAPEIAVKCVRGVDEAIAHVNRYGTHHSEAIVTTDASAADAFTRGVDAAAVYVNASTAFTDGGQFGLGAEIGISTQKLHARGPFALDALTSYKYVLHGDGQTRD